MGLKITNAISVLNRSDQEHLGGMLWASGINGEQISAVSETVFTGPGWRKQKTGGKFEGYGEKE